MSNLGNAYAQWPGAGRADELRRAVACYREALRIYTRDAAPFDYAGTQVNLGHAYARLAEMRRAADRPRAVACYEEALRIYTPDATPDPCRMAAYQLGGLHFRRSRWEEAYSAYQTADDALEARYRSAMTEASRHAELSEARNLHANMAFCLARLGRFDRAVERLEAGKARGLAEALDRDRAAPEGAKSEDRAAFEAARRRIGALQAETRAAGAADGPDRAPARTIFAISDDLRDARRDLDEAIRRIRADAPGFMPPALDLRAISAAAAPGSPLVYLITTSRGSAAFIVPPAIDALGREHVVWLDRFRDDDLDRLLVRRDGAGDVVGGYLVGQVLGDERALESGLDEVLPVLRDRLMGPLAARLARRGFQRATLVDGGRLSLLPLHAAGPGSVEFSYAPSARALKAAGDMAADRAARAPVLLGIGNPLPSTCPLAFARAEVEEIAPRFPAGSRRILFEREATAAAVAGSLPGATHLHFSCHGVFDVGEPLDSALSLAGDDRLTLRELLDGGLDLSAARLAVLSACQTGIADFNEVPNEAVGFPAGLIQAGVPGVVSTLWPVDDLSTAILMGRFYLEHREHGLDPPSALHRALDWLRTATARDMGLAERYESLYRASGGRDLDAFVAWRHHRAQPRAKPFAHPFYWAAFTLTGVG
jgi:CHAT domain-containing protein/tetratricopeptide (TPR) repeat protein